ncbi:hypothetical protein P0D75_18425 [Paraburkholderia sediminicola]|uniref:hypothetical protein n=1 Tax=Paraburkholderia sediminicola TaxID=458836 RepID=UPI0038B8D560
MAKTFASAKTTAPAAANIALVTETAGRFDFVTAKQAHAMWEQEVIRQANAATSLHDAHVAARPAPVAAKAPAARISRERFDADDALISFIQANQWNDLKTQKILDGLRAQGRACGMARLNKLLGRDSKGNPLPAVEAEKA